MSNFKYLAILIFVGLSLFGFGQINLIPNYSFEEFKKCQDINPEVSINELFFWFNPSNGTPDYYNSCSSDPLKPLSVPTHNSYYTKYPYNGNAYIGMFLYVAYKIDNFLREYLSIKLSSELLLNKKYFIQFYASPKDSIDGIAVPCYIDKLGASLSNNEPSEQILANQSMRRQKYIGNESIILDRIDQWTRISGCVIGDGEQYLTIGNFFTDAETKLGKDCTKYFPNSAYYYIDDVGVYEFDPLPDTILLCDGESRGIGRKFLDGTYQWNTGSQDSTIVVSKSGTYIVNVDMGSCILSDTVVVIKMSNVDTYLPTDTTICDGTNYNVEIPIPGKFLWNTGSSNNIIEISKEGLYSVQIENQCGTFNHTFNVMTQECDCQIHTPNIFSPNNDAVNDEMKFYMDCQYPYQIKSLKIYDRWGNMVFEQIKNINNEISWSGKFNGNLLSSGLYCWVINFTYLDSGREISKIKSGNVTIIH
jgi:gliding motility-associated-like protein